MTNTMLITKTTPAPILPTSLFTTCPGCDEAIRGSDKPSAQGYCESCESIQQAGGMNRSVPDATGEATDVAEAPEESFESYWKRTLDEARAHDWSGFVKTMTQRSAGTHAYRVTKPAEREWPQTVLLAAWCDGYCINFGSGITIHDANSATVTIYVD